jgi:hypothetical protein
MPAVDPMMLATVVLALVGGAAVGRLLVGRIVGSCLTTIFGLIVLGIVVAYILHGRIEMTHTMTRMLAAYIHDEFPAFIAFVVGMVAGAGLRRRP